MARPDFAADVHAAALDSFGEPVDYTPLGGAPVSIVGIFRAAHVRLDLESGAPVHSDQPRLDVRLLDLPSGLVSRGDRVVVRGVDYLVGTPERDGEGMASLPLSR